MANTPSRHGADDRWRAAVDRRLHALETRPATIPVRIDDPPADSPVSLWMTTDGRLRGRRADTGAVVELQRMATPGAPPALSWPTGTDVYPLTVVAELPATWAASFESTGAPAPTGTFGHGRALLLGWPRGVLETALTALVSVDRVEVFVYHVGENPALDPLPVAVGVHQFNPSAPGSYVPGTLSATREILLPAVGAGWHQIDPADWNVSASGTSGVLVDQGAAEQLAGRIHPPGSGAGLEPRLRITFRCLVNVGGTLI